MRNYEGVPETLHDRTVLVTGGAGFVGSHVADALAPVTDLRVLDDLRTGDRANVPADATFVEGDVRDEAVVADAMDGVDVTFHLAATPERSAETPRERHAVAVDGTLAVLAAARERDVRVVGASSAAVYGDPGEVPVGEDVPLDPTSLHGLQSLAVDRYLRLYDDLYDLPTVALRLFDVYGPRQRPDDGVVAALRQRALAGDSLTVPGDGSRVRDLVHVDDVVRAFLAAAVTDATGESYNVGSGTGTTDRDLAAFVRDLAGTDADIETANGDGATGTVDTGTRHGDGAVGPRVADVGKASVVLGYHPETSLRDGLAGLFPDG